MTGKLDKIAALLFLAMCVALPEIRASDNAPRKIEHPKEFSANWITDKNALYDQVGVYAFGRKFDLKTLPEKFEILVSADPKCKLWVNGKWVLNSPAAGEPRRWYYDTIDIAPFLKEGENCIAAAVWNFGSLRPFSQMSNQTAFFLQCEKIEPATPELLKLKRDFKNKWVSKKLKGYPRPPPAESGVQAGSNEIFDAKAETPIWKEKDFSKGWSGCVSLSKASEKSDNYGITSWRLTPRDIPLLCQIPIPAPLIAGKNEAFSKPIKIGPNSKKILLLDQTELVNAHPILRVSGGKGAKISIKYAENLYLPLEKAKILKARGEKIALTAHGAKGNRNDLKDKVIARCRTDIYFPDGGIGQEYSPLDFRTFRFVELEVQTGSDPVVLESFESVFTGYPFKRRASFSCGGGALSESDINSIREIGWRTARLCAADTYYDCPFYERLQYVGDTRVQAFISLYECADPSLMRKAILLFDMSRDSEGLTMCMYPARIRQVIPPFSLVWIFMLRDYLMYVGEPDFIENRLGGVETVLAWFDRHFDEESGMLKKNIPHWNFVDWTDSWVRGVPPSGEKSGSAVETMLYAMALDDSAFLFERFGRNGEKFRARSDKIRKSVFKRCWNKDLNMLRDAEGLEQYSQHAQILGVLSGTIPENLRKKAMKSALDKTRKYYQGKKRGGTPEESADNEGNFVADTTMYFKFYLSRALKKAGMGDEYAKILPIWKEFLALGLTTFPETPDPSRSECHAWSSSPNCDLFAIVCGISSEGEGFRRVRVEPSPGDFDKLDAKIPHPSGEISFSYRGNKFEISLPEKTEGTFVFKGKNTMLKPGKNEIFVERDRNSGSSER